MYDWLKPIPFWQEGVQEQGTELVRPQLLEFQNDAFMEEFLAESDTANPSQVAALKKRVLLKTPGKSLKLYQPAHGRYYLVCASLCCREWGFPDREVRRNERETISFVLRKQVTKDGVTTEWGWIVEGTAKKWTPVPDPMKVLDKEERLPLFSTTPCCSRRLIYGYIPVASGETYKQPIQITNANELDELDRRMSIFEEEIGTTLNFLKASKPTTTRLHEEVVAYLLLDLLAFLEAYLPNVAKRIRGEAVALTAKEDDVFRFLQTLMLRNNANSDISAVAAMNTAASAAQMDTLHFTFEAISATWHTLNDAGAHENDLYAKIKANLPPDNTPPTLTADVLKNASLPGEQFVIRCVYERPCDAPYPPRRWVSQPTLPFQMAPFFDTDAPARTIRIELPTDTSLAAMRKFKKSVGFVISDSLRNKMQMIAGREKGFLKDNDTGGEGTWSLGMLCSLSIPIITLCAFILLFVIVFVLNIVFWWVPFFRICLPIPKKGN